MQARAVCIGSALRGWLDETVLLESYSTGSLKGKLQGGTSLTALGPLRHWEPVALSSFTEQKLCICWQTAALGMWSNIRPDGGSTQRGALLERRG